MIERLEIGGYVVEYDREATAAAYSCIVVSGPESCGCWYCRNWAAGRERVVPAAVRDLLTRLGVPLAGEIEVWEVPDEEHAHLYGGWYMVIGRLVSRPPEEAREFTMAGWRMSWSSGPSYEVSQFAGEQVCELHFLSPVGDFIAPAVAPAERAAAPDPGRIQAFVNSPLTEPPRQVSVVVRRSKFLPKENP